MGVAGDKKQKEEVDKEQKNEPKNEAKKELKDETKNDGKNEIDTGHRPIPVKIVNKVTKTVCKINIEINGKIAHGTVFLNYSDTKKYLMTCYHVITCDNLINPSLDKNKIELEIHNQKIMQLNFDNRFTKYMKEPIDIAIIEIKESDEIYDEIEYLNIDKNFTNGGYSIYKEADVFTVEHPGGEDASYASGRILDWYDEQLEHDITTDKGASGSPIILLNNNINLIGVIGIHKNGVETEKIKKNYGTFIGEILYKELNKELNKKLNKKFNRKMKKNLSTQLNKRFNNNKFNYIISVIVIKDKDVNNYIRILNSYEEYSRNGKNKDKLIKNSNFDNEEEIKKCEIKINDELIPFNYHYKFKSKGK